MTTEDAALILLRYENGARGSVAVSQVSAGRKNSLQWEIDGAVSAAWWDSETPDHLYLGHRGRPNEILQRGAELMNATGTAAAVLPGGHVEGFGDTFHALFRTIYSAILAGQPPEEPRVRHVRGRPPRDGRGRRHRAKRPRRSVGRGGCVNHDIRCLVSAASRRSMP